MSDPSRIPTNLRTLLILEVLGKSDRALTATEINEEIGLPKQTVHRLCTTLEQEGFLTRQGTSKRFQAARRLRDLGAGLLHNSRSHIARHQILVDVARQVGETVNFVAPEAEGMNYIDRVETDWPFRIQLPVGTHVPFHCTASGKSFMASLAPKARESFVASLELQKLTPMTRIDSGALLSELAQIARQGYSLDHEEFVEGMVAAAVPVRDDKGRFIAALAVHGPTQRIEDAEEIARSGVLQAAAIRLRRMLFADAPETVG